MAMAKRPGRGNKTSTAGIGAVGVSTEFATDQTVRGVQGLEYREYGGRNIYP
jgi:hypothetical protein